MKFTYITLSIVLPTAALCMESQELLPLKPGNNGEAPQVVVLDFSDDHHQGAHLSADIVRAIKGGKVAHLRSALSQPKTRAGRAPLDVVNNIDQLGSALGLAQGELALQQDLMAKGLFDHFMARYKHVAIPAFITAASLANLIANAYDYAHPDPALAASQQNTGSFAINMAASGLATLGFGYRTIKEIRKAILDTRKKKLVEQLETSHLYLQKLHELAMKDGVITAQEQAGIDAATQQQAQLQTDLALVDAELATIAKEEAAANGQQGGAPVMRKRSVVEAAHDQDKATGKQDADALTPAATLTAALAAASVDAAPAVAQQQQEQGAPTDGGRAAVEGFPLQIIENPAFGLDVTPAAQEAAPVEGGANNNGGQTAAPTQDNKAE